MPPVAASTPCTEPACLFNARPISLKVSPIFKRCQSSLQAFKFINFSTVVTDNPANIKGAKIDLNLHPVDGLELMAGGSYVDAKVKNVTISNALGSAIVNRKPRFTSKWRAVLSARYQFPLAEGMTSIQGDLQYRDDSYFSLTNFDATKVGAYTLLNMRIAWTALDGRWKIAGLGKNLSDKRYRTVGFEAPDFGGWTQAGYGEPRWYGVSLSFKY
jgi:iron complex outermembrane receptor protein